MISWFVHLQLLSQQANDWVLSDKEKNNKAITQKYSQASAMITDGGVGGVVTTARSGDDDDDDDDDDLFFDTDDDKLKNSLFSDVSSWMQTHFSK